jgi:hypothetical protein
MKYSFLVIIFFIVIGTFCLAEENEKKDSPVSFKLSGYIKNDFFYDTRQTVSAREGHFLLWPMAPSYDATGYDINTKNSFNFLSIQSRLRLTVSGPDALGAKLSGILEGDFFATTNDNINLFRLRHAAIKLNWERTELLTGQYWNPLFVEECFPGTVSFNTGAPMQSVGRNPQIRVTHKVGHASIIGAVLGQRDFASIGPAGASSEYLRNSGIPELQAQAHYTIPVLKFGGGLSYKIITPRLSSEMATGTYKVDETATSLSVMGFMKITLKPIIIKFQGRYGENNTDVLGIGGYAVRDVVNNETGQRSYAPLYNTAFWADIQNNGKKVEVGIFGGFIKNHGTKEAIDPVFAGNEIIYGFGHTIDFLYRVSPRVVYNTGKLRLALEGEYTTAAFGMNHNLNWRPKTITEVENCRILTSIGYYF